MNLLEQLVLHSSGLTPSRVIGIDLGTTNCTVAQVELPVAAGSHPDAACKCLSIQQETQSGSFAQRLVPSVIAIEGDGKIWIGEGAKRMRSDPQTYGFVPEKSIFYDTKNDIGLKKRYHRATEDFDHPWKISGHLLRFLGDGARKAGGLPVVRQSVTVPASFQLAQRQDTLKAAELAGLGLGEDDFLDEPVAALIDYLFTVAPDTIFERPSNVLVLDFGGGTCDVFIARLGQNPEAGFTISPRAVSRYHRLGGCDLDAAIIHQHLIPLLLAENGLGDRFFEFTDRKRFIEPALRGCAEALKEGICREISQLQLHGKYAEADKDAVVAQMMALEVKTPQGNYILKKPRLTAAEWEKIAAPYFDPETLYCKEEDYVLVQSIFAPLTDAVRRAGVQSKEVDFVLLAGGSSMIPQLRTALAAFFDGARIESFPDSTGSQTAIARGAAWATAWKSATGKPLIQPVTGATLALQLSNREQLPLVQAGTAVPYPLDGSWRSISGLSLPKPFNGRLSVKIIAMPDEQEVISASGEFPECRGGEALNFEFRLTAARVLESRFALADGRSEAIEAKCENPLVNVVNPSAIRMEIEEIEEELRDATRSTPGVREKMLRLASLYTKIRKREKASAVYKSTLQIIGRPDPDILNLQALNYEEIGDFNRMEAAFAASMEASDDGAAAFNWALHCRKRRRIEDALAKVDEALFREPDSGPYHILRADLLKALGQSSAATEAAEYGVTLFDEVSELGSWELHWLGVAAKMLGDRGLEQRIAAARIAETVTSGEDQGQAPTYNKH
jgi:molecular chaperone DnaK (HSP70)/tetratricopeptide (TPR) repeat protein